MNIVILASIWAQNLGDELILKNEIKLLERQFQTKNPKFAVFTYDKKNIFYKKKNIEYFEYFPIWIKNPKNFFRNIKNFFNFIKIIFVSDLVVIWWWWIFFDNEKSWSNNNLKQWNFRTKIIRFFKKNLLFWAVWIDIKNKNNLKILSNIFKKAYNITVRDKYSKEILDSINIKSKILKDPVFFDRLWDKNLVNNPIEKNLILWKKYKNFNLEDLEKIDFSWKKIGIAFRKGFLTEKFIKNLIDYLLEKNVKQIIFIPHSFHKTDINSNDFIFLEKFYKKIKQKDKVKICKNLDESYEVYKNKQIDINFAMRLHSIILSLVYDIKVIWISYSKKTENLLKEI